MICCCFLKKKKLFYQEESTRLRESFNSKSNEIVLLQSKLEHLEKENSLLRNNNKCIQSKRIVSKNFIKSSPESSQCDKSGSELSKKFASKGNLIFEKEFLLRNEIAQSGLSEFRYKTVD